MKTGAELIAEERQRQIDVEGWTKEHDTQHKDGELAKVAICYADPVPHYKVINRLTQVRVPNFNFWPKTWGLGWFKPTNRIRNLVKAGALIAAEIDRLQNEEQNEQKSSDNVEPKFKVGDVVINKKSKDTVKIVQILHDSYCYSGWDGAATVHSDFSISEQDNWELVEQKPVDKVEPKFKIGDWVVTDKNNIVQIKAIENGKYVLENTMRFSVDYVDKCWRKWEISDAKDGDVLFTSSTASHETFIFKSIDEKGNVKCYFAYDSEDGFREGKYHFIGRATNCKPATKGQRDLLFQKMREAGYEWNAGKKELKKIEQNPVEWSEEDERMYRGLHNLIYSTPYCDSRTELSDWLKFLKDSVQSKQKQEWDKEDEKCIKLSTDIIDSALRAGFCVQLDRDRCVDWLKSLKDKVQPKVKWSKEDKERYISCLQRLSTGNPEQPETINSKWFKEHVYPQSTWKPTKEQIRRLEYFVKLWGKTEDTENTKVLETVKSLLNDLKQL